MNETTARNLTLDDAIADVEMRYVAAHPKSKAGILANNGLLQ